MISRGRDQEIVLTGVYLCCTFAKKLLLIPKIQSVVSFAAMNFIFSFGIFMEIYRKKFVCSDILLCKSCE